VFILCLLSDSGYVGENSAFSPLDFGVLYQLSCSWTDIRSRHDVVCEFDAILFRRLVYFTCALRDLSWRRAPGRDVYELSDSQTGIHTFKNRTRKTRTRFTSTR